MKVYWTAKHHAEIRLDMKKERTQRGLSTDFDDLVKWCDSIAPEYGHEMHWVIFGYHLTGSTAGTATNGRQPRSGCR